MVKCNFCTEARESLDATVEVALASIDTSMEALTSLHTSMAKAKWGRRLIPDRKPFEEERRQGDERRNSRHD